MVNAARLQQIAWAVLGGEVLHVLIAMIMAYMATSATPSDGSYLAFVLRRMSITGWLVVLLLFVLARAFETGARMREDLEGTV